MTLHPKMREILPGLCGSELLRLTPPVFGIILKHFETDTIEGRHLRYPTLATDTAKQGAPQSAVEPQPRRWPSPTKGFPTRAKNWLRIWQRPER